MVSRGDADKCERSAGEGDQDSDEFNVLMAEVVATRGDPAQRALQASDGEPLTAEDIQRLIDRADSDKLREARERL
ncbi:MAG: hypothetical protein DMG76_09280 [Acidobacteria bacterium]|nr:MAG: hypothetical protein DMG76_09280 [Acidobacteriota bacterium]